MKVSTCMHAVYLWKRSQKLILIFRILRVPFRRIGLYMSFFFITEGWTANFFGHKITLCMKYIKKRASWILIFKANYAEKHSRKLHIVANSNVLSIVMHRVKITVLRIYNFFGNDPTYINQILLIDIAFKWTLISCIIWL